MSNQKKTIVITGGRGGIGYFSALGIAKSGARIILIGRNQERGKEKVTNHQRVTIAIFHLSLGMYHLSQDKIALFPKYAQKLNV